MQGLPSGGDSEDDLGEEPLFAEINVTPLTDVFIVLLIIFMVVASASVEVERSQGRDKLPEEAMVIQTPQGGGNSEIVKKDLVISVTREGVVFVDSEEVARESLASVLQKKRQEAGPLSRRVVIRGDETAQYALIVEILTLSEQAGFSDLALATQ